MNAREIGDEIKHRIITIYGCADASMQDASAAQEMVTQMVAEIERLRMLLNDIDRSGLICHRQACGTIHSVTPCDCGNWDLQQRITEALRDKP